MDNPLFSFLPEAQPNLPKQLKFELQVCHIIVIIFSASACHRNSNIYKTLYEWPCMLSFFTALEENDQKIKSCVGSPPFSFFWAGETALS